MVPKNLFAGQQWRNRHREQTYRHGKRGGEGEKYGDSNVETYIVTCNIDAQGESAVCLRKLKQGLCINLEGWMGRHTGGSFKREDIYGYLWQIHPDVYKKEQNTVKPLSFNVKNK